MQKVAFVVACLTWAGHGRRVSGDAPQTQRRSHGTIDPQRPLAELMLARCPSVSFSSSGPLGLHFRTGQGSRGCNVGRQWTGHSSGAMQATSRALMPRCRSMRMSALSGLSAFYAAQLHARPVITQSLTSGVMFGLSDWTAQTLAPSDEGKDIKRTIVTALIGLLYYGPALYHYLQLVYRLFPGTGFKGTIQKMLFGQIGFGPALTCIFFGAFLVKDNGLVTGLKMLPSKIRQDLFLTWVSELGFWPFVDLICYSLIPPRWIPLANNMASFLWTIFLSLRAALKVEPTAEIVPAT